MRTDKKIIRVDFITLEDKENKLEDAFDLLFEEITDSYKELAKEVG